jgi:5'-nucleotidase
MSKVATLIQFNDAYHLAQGRAEPVGGAARFGGLVQQYHDKNPLVVCSGDIFSPSLMSTVFRGKHMAEVCSALKTRVAVVGNHDFDLGLDQLVKLAHMMPDTKWLLSNVFDSRDGTILGGFCDHYVIQHSGIKIGFLGLVEVEWIATLSMDTSNVTAKDPIEVGTLLAKKLREEDGVDVVVALTHSRMPNDILLAQKAVGIDLILGGHDHEAYHEFVNGIHVAKSGTEFRYASICTITLEQGSKKPKIDYELVPVDSNVPEDPEIVEITKRFSAEMEEKMKKPIGWVTRDLDARAGFVRMNECEIGNLLTDIMRNEVESDFAILNAGTIRTDAIIPRGFFTMKDLFNLLPFEDLTCKTEITGATLWKAMENGVSQYPKHEGRFPQISGFSFTFDPNQAPGSRVVEISINGHPIDLTKTYTLACKPYISIDGKDGYDCFLGSKSLISLEECFINSQSFANYLRRLAIVQVWKHSMEHPQSDVVSQAKIAHSDAQLPAPTGTGTKWALASIGPPKDPKTHHFKHLVHGVVDDLHNNLAHIDPVLEGRIKIVPLRPENATSVPVPSTPSPVLAHK